MNQTTENLNQQLAEQTDQPIMDAPPSTGDMLFQDGMLVRTLNVETVTVNPEFSKDLFDMEAIQSRYLPVEREEGASEALDEVKKTIEEFKRRFE